VGFRLFGRGKDDDGEASCSRCGRTLLAGEWTQRLVDDDGGETYLCSLCVGGAGVPDDVAPDEATFETTPAGSGKVRSTRTESDAFWRAIKDKDAEIERLESRLARVEAEKQELAAEVARLRERSAPSPTAVVTPPSTDIVAGPPPGGEADRTDPGLGERLRGSAGLESQPEAAMAGEPALPQVEPAPPFVEPTGAPEDALDRPVTVATPPADAEAGSVAPATGPMTPLSPAFTLDDEGSGASLTILQRGIDLLNVSAVPRRIVETNESLGIPTVHVGSEAADTLLVTFLWTMGWYQFRVELSDGGRVSLAERGYDQRADLPPNASVRPDGTVQIAAAMIKQASADRGTPPHDDGPPAAPTTTSGTIISKSLMGQRTDDENVPPAWGSKNAPDFDWGR
jgi:hypothetical protein